MADDDAGGGGAGPVADDDADAAKLVPAGGGGARPVADDSAEDSGTGRAAKPVASAADDDASVASFSFTDGFPSTQKKTKAGQPSRLRMNFEGLR